MNKEQKLVQALSRGKLSISELSTLIHKPNKITKNILYELKRQHFNLKHSKGVWWIDDMRSTVKTYMYSPAQKTPSTLIYGSLSDLHIGCTIHRKDKLLDYFNRAYNDFGVKRFLIAGDLTDGINVYQGQHNFLTQFNQQDQVDEVCDELPDWNGLEYLIIDGNHDYSFTKNGAPLTGKLISNQRSDIHYLGYNVGDILWDGIRIRMLHGAGGGCFDDQTEILTEDGWKFFDELDGSEKVATLNQNTHSFEWQKPYAYTDEEYNGEMVHFKARSMDLFVTPNHRMFVRRTPSKLGRLKEIKHLEKSHQRINTKWIEKTARELVNDFSRQKWQMTKCCKSWESGKTSTQIKIPLRKKKKYASKEPKHIGNLDIKIVAELIAWYVTEGHIDKSKDCVLTICQDDIANEDNWIRIVNLLKSIGLSVSISGKNNKNIKIYSTELCDWLISECGRGSRNKRIPKWLRNTDEKILQIVFDTMVKGDGWINRKGYGYKSINPKLVDDFSEIAIKLGYGVTFDNKDSISISKIQVNPSINMKPSLVDYNGRIYCVSVPNETIFVRRNGKTMWTKNSYAVSYPIQRYLRNVMQSSRENLPDVMHVGHYHTRIDGFHAEGVTATSNGHFQEPNEWYVRRGFVGPMGGHIVDIEVENGKKKSFNARWLGE